jgi:hypothetical protein
MNIEKIKSDFLGEMLIDGERYTVSTVHCYGKIYRTEIFTAEKTAFWQQMAGKIYSLQFVSASFTGFVTKRHSTIYSFRTSRDQEANSFEATLYIKNIGIYNNNNRRYGKGGNIGLFLPDGIWRFIQSEIEAYNSGSVSHPMVVPSLDDKMFEI